MHIPLHNAMYPTQDYFPDTSAAVQRRGAITAVTKDSPSLCANDESAVGSPVTYSVLTSRQLWGSTQCDNIIQHIPLAAKGSSAHTNMSSRKVQWTRLLRSRPGRGPHLLVHEGDTSSHLPCQAQAQLPVTVEPQRRAFLRTEAKQDRFSKRCHQLTPSLWTDKVTPSRPITFTTTHALQEAPHQIKQTTGNTDK